MSLVERSDHLIRISRSNLVGDILCLSTQFGVLGGLRGLVEKDVETDGAHAGGLQRAQEIGEETAAQRRAVGRVGE